MIYVCYDQFGNITAVSTSQSDGWLEFHGTGVVHPSTHYVIDSELLEYTEPERARKLLSGLPWDNRTMAPVADESAKAGRAAAESNLAAAAVDEAAGRTRLKYITSVPGQAETYQRKEQQAREWAATGFTGDAPSFIAAEAQALNLDPTNVATEVIQLADYWANVKGPEIEATRRKWKVAVEAAGTDISAITAARDAGIAALEAL